MRKKNDRGAPVPARRWAALAALLLLGVAGCHQQARTPGEYRNPAKGFSIVFPPDWQVKENEMGLDVIALAPGDGPSDQFHENVTVSSAAMPSPLEAQQILAGNLEAMRKVITEFKPEDRGTVEINGVKAAWLSYRQLQGQFRLKVKLYALPGRDRAYLIHCVAEELSAPSYEDRFATIARSFRSIP
jgi:hypothetical protein